MLTRIAAVAGDAWLRVAGVARGEPGGTLRGARVRSLRLGRVVWRGGPGDLLGVSIALACGVPPSGRRVARPGADDAVLIADPRLARYLDAVPLRPFAQTLGRYVLSREPIPDPIVRHELVHVGQWERLGPFFLPLYGLASLRAMLRGGDRYRDNSFEVVARAAEVPGAGADAVTLAPSTR